MLLRSCCRPLERCFGRRCGGDVLQWHVDLKPHASGDFSVAVVQANHSLEDQGQVWASPLATYVGVYDGHGGPEASRFIHSRLFPHLNRFAVEHGGLSEDVIRKAFSATEEEFLQMAKSSLLSRPQIASAGSCCLVGAIADDVLYVANLGDSRAVLGRRGADGRAVAAERLSSDHNVAEEEVRKELVKQHPDDSHIVVLVHGVWRIKGIIQVSRSIGDMYLKQPEFCRDPVFQHFVCPVPLKKPVMTAEPSIQVRDLGPQDLFLIFASDGLWEQLSDEAAVEIVCKNPRAVSVLTEFPNLQIVGLIPTSNAKFSRSGIAKRLVKAALSEAAKKREMRYDDLKGIEKGIRRHFHDDITVIVIYLDQRRQRNLRVKGDSVGCSTPVDIFSHMSHQSEVPLHPML